MDEGRIVRLEVHGQEVTLKDSINPWQLMPMLGKCHTQSLLFKCLGKIYHLLEVC